MNMPTRDRRRRGFTLMTMLAVLLLLGVGALLATKLFLASMRTTAAAQETHTRIVRFEGMIRHLRQDVWGAGAITAADASSLELRNGELALLWHIQPDGTITRTTAGEPVHRWALAPAVMRFEPGAAGLYLHISEDRTGHEQAIALVSQLLLQGGSR
jgi:hypothetical protein